MLKLKTGVEINSAQKLKLKKRPTMAVTCNLKHFMIELVENLFYDLAKNYAGGNLLFSCFPFILNRFPEVPK